jgi:hypothetical protein
MRVIHPPHIFARSDHIHTWDGLFNDAVPIQCQSSLVSTGWMAGVRFPSGVRFFSSPQDPDRLWGPPRLFNGYQRFFLRVNMAGAWRWLLTSIYCRGQEWWSYNSTPPYVFMACCLIKHRDKFILAYVISVSFFFLYFPHTHTHTHTPHHTPHTPHTHTHTHTHTPHHTPRTHTHTHTHTHTPPYLLDCLIYIVTM